MAEHLEKFLFTNLSCDVMADGGAKDLPFDCWQHLEPILYQRLADRSESISIVKNKRTQILALTANVERLVE